MPWIGQKFVRFVLKKRIFDEAVAFGHSVIIVDGHGELVDSAVLLKQTLQVFISNLLCQKEKGFD
jgi:hypothetical protein